MAEKPSDAALKAAKEHYRKSGALMVITEAVEELAKDIDAAADEKYAGLLLAATYALGTRGKDEQHILALRRELQKVRGEG